MKVRHIILFFGMFLIACQNTDRQTNTEIKIVNRLDLYPQYPSCPDYYEKEQQLTCLKEKLTHFLSDKLSEEYQKQNYTFPDSILLKLKIDTLGITHLIKIKFSNQTFQDSITRQIFTGIIFQIPQMKPAIYHDKPVNFEFSIPIVQQKNIEK